MTTSVKSVQGFCQKYQITEPYSKADKDSNQPGIQTAAGDVEEAKRDFDSLSAKDRYFIIMKLKKNQDTQFLRYLFPPDTSQPPNERIIALVKALGTKVQSKTLSIWEKRLELQTHICLISEHLKKLNLHYNVLYPIRAELNNLSSMAQRRVEVVNGEPYLRLYIWVRETLFREFMKIYRLGASGVKGNPLFDTDEDGVFDHVDFHPLEPNPRGVKLRENILGYLKDGETRYRHGDDFLDMGDYKDHLMYEVTRKGRSINLKVKILLVPKNGSVDISKITNRENEIEDLFNRLARAAGLPNVKLDIEFVNSLSLAHHVILVTNRRRRHKPYLLTPSISNAELLHEIAHLSGFKDWYHEYFSPHDYTFRPGLAFFSRPGDLMHSYFLPKIKIRKRDLIMLVAGAKDKKPKPEKSSRFYFTLGLAEWGRRNPGQSISWYHKAVNAFYFWPHPHVELGRAFLGIKQYRIVKNEFEKILPLFPNNYDLQSIFATAQLRQGNIDASIQSIKRAIEINPDVPDAYSILGQILEKKGKYAEAEIEFRYAIHLDPLFAEAYFYLARVLAKRGDLKKAIEILQYSLRLMPNNHLLYTDLGIILVDYSKDHDKIASVVLDKSLSMEPRDHRTHFYRGVLYTRQKQGEKAEEHLKFALKASIKPADSHYYLGVALDLQGKKKEAREEFQKAIKLKPSHEKAKKALRSISFQKRSVEQTGCKGCTSSCF